MRSWKQIKRLIGRLVTKMFANYNIESIEKMKVQLKNNISQEISESVRRINKSIKNIQDVLNTSKQAIAMLISNLEEKIEELKKEIKEVKKRIHVITCTISTSNETSSSPILIEEKEEKEQEQKEIEEHQKQQTIFLANVKDKYYIKLQKLEEALEKCKTSKTECDDYVLKVSTYISDTTEMLARLDVIFKNLTIKIDGLCVKLDEVKAKLFEYSDIYPSISGEQFRKRRKTKTGYYNIEKVQDYKKYLKKTSSAIEQNIFEMAKFHREYDQWQDINFEKTQIILEHTGKIISSMKDNLSENTKIIDLQTEKIEEYLSYAKKIK